MKANQPLPTSIRIFLADGSPDGLRIVEKSNWTGRAIWCNRSQVERAFQRDEMSQPGVYLLTGITDDGLSQIYIGEADVLSDRIKQHLTGKDFWTELVAFVSTNESLNKAHVRYLESRLISLAKEANQWLVENNTAPKLPPMSEMDRADAEGFLAEMLLILPLLGVDAFESASVQVSRSSQQSEEHSPELYLHARGAYARGHEVANGFVVLKGSRARLTEVPSIRKRIKNLRRQLIEQGVLKPEGDSLIFTQDFRFSSPSAAAGVLVGGESNGLTAWKDASGRTLKSLQRKRAEHRI